VYGLPGSDERSTVQLPLNCGAFADAAVAKRQAETKRPKTRINILLNGCMLR
jgi:hypothetical protein